MTNLDLVSIALCTHNGGEYLKEQIDSIINQTYKNIELIAIDDCSTDNSYQVLQQYAKVDKRIKVYKNERNLGYNKNFEKACQLVTGEFIAISDHDDIWKADKIEKMMKLWTSSDIILVHSSYASFQDFNNINYKHQSLRKPFIGNDAREFFLDNHICGHNMMFKKKLFQLATPFPKHIYYDWWLSFVACCNGSINASNETLTFHRIHNKNVSGSLEANKKYWEFALNNIGILLNAPNISNETFAFGQRILSAFKILENKIFSFEVFSNILRNSSVLFNTKKRFLPYFSYLKNALKIATRSTKKY